MQIAERFVIYFVCFVLLKLSFPKKLCVCVRSSARFFIDSVETTEKNVYSHR